MFTDFTISETTRIRKETGFEQITVLRSFVFSALEFGRRSPTQAIDVYRSRSLHDYQPFGSF